MSSETNPRSPIEFWFDFNSPYAYFASREIDGLARRHGRDVSWRPFLLGVVSKITGFRPLTEVPMRGQYSQLDWERLSRWKGVPYQTPNPFLVSPVPATRLSLWLDQTDHSLAKRFMMSVFDARFIHQDDISQLKVLVDLAEKLGVTDAAQAASSELAKALARSACDEAIAKSIFGAPFFIADGEPFWGNDRLPMLDAFLERESSWSTV